MGLSLKDPCNHKLTNKCNARVFYGGRGPRLPVGRGVEGEERRQREKGGNTKEGHLKAQLLELDLVKLNSKVSYVVCADYVFGLASFRVAVQ